MSVDGIFKGTTGGSYDVATRDLAGKAVQLMDVATVPSTTVSGTLANEDDTVEVDCTSAAAVTFGYSGIYDTPNILIEQTFDGVTWFTAVGVAVDIVGGMSLWQGSGVSSNSSGVVSVATMGATAVRLRQAGGPVGSGQVDIVAAAIMTSPAVPATTVIGRVDVVIVDTDGDLAVSIGGTVATTGVNGSAFGALAAVDETVTVINANDVMVQVTGDLDGTLVAEISLDGSNWFTVDDSLLIDITTGIGGPLSSSGLWMVNTDSLLTNFRVRCSVYNSGTAAVVVSARDIV